MKEGLQHLKDELA
jgi:hypothetical protein